MKEKIEYLSRKQSLVLTFTLFAILCLLSNTLFQSDFTYLTQTFAYSPAKAYHLLFKIGQSGRTNHLFILLSDLCMILLYTAFLLGVMYRLSTKLSKNCHLITLLTFIPLLLSIVQLAEIICTAVLIIDYSDQHITLARCASMFTTSKFILMPIIFCLPLLLFGVKLFITSNKRKNMNEYKC